MVNVDVVIAWAPTTRYAVGVVVAAICVVESPVATAVKGMEKDRRRALRKDQAPRGALRAQRLATEGLSPVTSREPEREGGTATIACGGCGGDGERREDKGADREQVQIGCGGFSLNN